MKQIMKKKIKQISKKKLKKDLSFEFDNLNIDECHNCNNESNTCQDCKNSTNTILLVKQK